MLRRMIPWLLAAALLTACGAAQTGAGATAAPDATAAPPTDAPAASQPTAPAQPAGGNIAPLREIVVAMPYIPNVQFAHFYVADAKKYYAAAGLKVTFDYNFETDVVQRVAQGTVQFGMASGDSVLLARAQGLPVVTVATNSQQFATVLFSKADSNIKTPADLKGKSVGIPGHFGASYIGLLALLYANKMQESDLNLQDIGFAQVAALAEGKVQVASGYGNNEPIQLEQQGLKVNVIKVSDFYPLASDGIIASEKLIGDQQDVVRGFVQATLKGMKDTIADPGAAFTTSLAYIPEAQRGDLELQRKVLQATLPYWQSDLTAKEGLGYTDLASWQATHTFMRDSGLLKSDVDVSKAFTNEFVK
ncbi:MAG: ABC transporter substrate-binding protein [Kouleothrix sp.]|nr:ABC transporter substrate-binding protein [Kouleothrix sp.]